MSKGSNSKATNILEIQNLIAGLQKHDTGKTFVVGGVSMTVADIITALKNYIAQLMAIAPLLAAYRQQVQVVDELETSSIHALRLNVDATLRVTYGASAGILTDYGIKPRKPAKRTAASVNEAVEKNLATRASHRVPAKPPTGNNPSGKTG
jgi:hypothetical protein